MKKVRKARCNKLRVSSHVKTTQQTLWLSPRIYHMISIPAMGNANTRIENPFSIVTIIHARAPLFHAPPPIAPSWECRIRAFAPCGSMGPYFGVLRFMSKCNRDLLHHSHCFIRLFFFFLGDFFLVQANDEIAQHLRDSAGLWSELSRLFWSFIRSW